MTAAQKNTALDLLKLCKTLAEAEKVLLQVRPLISQAARWGLFDGFVGRPQSQSGVSPQEKPNAKAERDYAEAWEIGRRLSMENEPA